LFELTGSGQNTASLTDLQVGPPSLTVDQINEVVSNATDNLSPSQDALLAQFAELQKQIDGLQKQIQCPCTELTAELEKQIQGLQVQPIVDVNAIIAAISAASSAPVTKTADFTVDDNETWIINNKSGSTCTVTLPMASAWTGRELTFKNLQAQTLVSASSNVVLIDSASAGTAILLAVVGNWATMVSDGTNWVIMQQAVNNCLLLE
jgi:glutamate/tyrosine decarboxylase-like PLP-dependent enzyme